MKDNLTLIEREASERFFFNEITSFQGFMKEITAVYESVCGEHGKQTFFEKVIPLLQELYSTNIRKMGLKALEIIDKGSSKKPSEIDKYFDGILLQKIREKNRILSFSEIEKTINSTILAEQNVFQKRFSCDYGIIGVVVIGSYANGNPNPESDLDLLYVMHKKNKCFVEDLHKIKYINNFNPQEDFKFESHFQSKLEKKLKKTIDFGVVLELDKKENFDIINKDSNNKPRNYKIISPYKWVHKTIEEYINSSGK